MGLVLSEADAEELIAERIMQHIVPLSAEVLPPDNDVRTQRYPVSGDAVPRLAECSLATHGPTTRDAAAGSPRSAA